MSPTFNGGGAGNGLASQTLNYGSPATFYVNVETSFEARIQLGATGGTAVSGTNGLQVQVFEGAGSTPVYDSVAGAGSFTLPMAISSFAGKTLHLQTGQYKVVLTNLDNSNPLSSVYATVDTTPAIS